MPITTSSLPTPTQITNQEKQLGTATTDCNEVCTSAADACVDLSGTLDAYLPSIPEDPRQGSTEKTYYSVIKEDNNVITVKACNAENGLTIQLSR